MFKLKPMFKALLPAAFSLFTLAAQADSIEMNRTVLSTGQPLSVAIVVDQYRSDNVYLAVYDAKGVYRFMNSQGSLLPYVAGQPTPSVLSTPQAGRYNIFNLTIPSGLVGGFNVYLIRAKAGVDLLAEVSLGKGDKAKASTNVDTSTLRSKRVQLNLPTSVSGDFDGDGYPDDDADHDGFHDDDADKDGYHDDDADHDGYHDDDVDHDGRHDDNADNDGHGSGSDDHSTVRARR